MPKNKSAKESGISARDIVGSTGVILGHDGHVEISQGVQGDELTKLIIPLRQAVQETDLPSEQKQEAVAEVNAIEKELVNPQPDGQSINQRLMKLVTLGGSIALAAMKLAQTPAIQALIQKALGR
ncbi:MAG: hypothetical protein JXA93_22810 [Anaerolineae bacterium]|nr:hypothetical protein [Anaerolineae bacterium]